MISFYKKMQLYNLREEMYMANHKEVIVKTIDDIKETVDFFYQQNDKEALKKFETVIGGMMSSIDSLVAYRNENSDFTFDETKIMDTLTEAMNALQDGDFVLLADILQYDFLEYMQELSDNME